MNDTIKIINAWINDLSFSTLYFKESGNDDYKITANALNLALCFKKILTDESYKNNWLEAVDGCTTENTEQTKKAYQIYEALPYLDLTFYYE